MQAELSRPFAVLIEGMVNTNGKSVAEEAMAHVLFSWFHFLLKV